MATQTVVISEHLPVVGEGASKVAILGFGTVGSSVARILTQEELPGLELVQVFNRNVERKRASWADSSVQWTQSFEDVLNSDVDVVVEVMGGVEPAHQWVRA